jgi:D-alanyl-lipoteichoic acid acyltransferase DltB (MBOAT superfamily)
VGISFYTFQTLGYTLDVYYGRTRAQQNIGKFGLYVSYFPQLVAGPIERFSHLSPQLFKQVKLNYENLQSAFRLILYGFFIKMVIADNLAPLVDEIFARPQEYDSLSTLGGILGFGWQIYADFYGYSLIAIGTAKAMGVNLMDNFKTPYFSASIMDFWRRWHISLSTWFRDYLYLPLGGNRVSKGFWIRNILAVFLLSGLWHGANWTFVIWGAIHAFMYFAERFTPVKWPRTNWWQMSLGWIITYTAVNLAWTFFRANSFDQATEVLSHVLSWQYSGESLEMTKLMFVLFTGFLIIEVASRKVRIDQWFAHFPLWFRWSLYSILMFCILAFSGTTNHPFIYFQF